MERLKLAIPKGRMLNPSIELLRRNGLAFQDYIEGNGRLCISVENRLIDLYFMREYDIPRFIAGGYMDFGIAGQITAAESEGETKKLQTLGFGGCVLVLATPITEGYNSLVDLASKRIATKYPRVVTNFFAQANIEVIPQYMTGSAEIACKIGYADAVADIVLSGNTMRLNGLEPRVPIFSSEMALIAGESGIKKSTEIQEFVQTGVAN